MNYHFLVGFHARLTKPTALSFYLEHEENEDHQQGVRAADKFLIDTCRTPENPRNSTMTEIEEVALSIRRALKEPPTDPQDALRIVFGLMDDTPAIVRAVAEALWERCRGEVEKPSPDVPGEPVAWMHDSPGRVDVIHAEVKKLLVDSHDAAGHLHRPLDKSEHYTIPLYTAPPPAVQGEPTGQDIQKAIDSAPEALRELGVYLGRLLDEDRWPEAERKLEAAVLAVQPTMNEPEEMNNAMQLAQGPMPTTLGELHDYLDSIRKAWSAQDTKYLGSYESQPLYILPNDPTPGFHLAKAKYFAEFGLTFIPVEGVSK